MTVDEYHKIHNIYSRDETTKRVVCGRWARPEFEFLQHAQWVFTEKVDGTNVRVMWDGERVAFGGKTDNASMPVPLLQALHAIFPHEKFTHYYDAEQSVAPAMCLYGEGYGGKIQGGGKYSPTPDFVLFDVKIAGLWLTREAVADVAARLGCQSVPIVMVGTLHDAVRRVADATGLRSNWGDFVAEGVVGRPATELLDRRGNRIIVKIKHRDMQSMLMEEAEAA